MSGILYRELSCKKAVFLRGLIRMYVHKRCVRSSEQLVFLKTGHGYCELCGNQGTIYLVRGTEDSYRTKIQGVTSWVTAVEFGGLTDEEVTFIKTKTNSTDIDIAPVETAPEAELTEETEAVEEPPTEAVEAVEEAAIPEEKQPEETPVEAESNDFSEELIVNAEAEEEPAEAVSEPPEPAMPEPAAEMPPVGMPVEAESEPEPVFTEEYLAKLEEARKADIARLEAELEALRK